MTNWYNKRQAKKYRKSIQHSTKTNEPVVEEAVIVEEPKVEEQIVEESVVVSQPELIIEETVTDAVPVEPTKSSPKPILPQRPAQHYNPNSANNLLNSILTSLLTQEYNRLHQQLLNIKQQLDAQKTINGEVVEESVKNEEDQTDVYNKSV